MKTNIKNGFSLLEVVVATGILGLVVALASGVLVQFMVVQRHDIAQQALQEDVRFTLELISREIRTGYGSTYTLTNGSGSGLAFRNQNSVCVMYQLNSITKQIERAESLAAGDNCSSSDFTTATFAPVSSHDTLFELVHFDPVISQANADGLPNKQGFVSIAVKARTRAQTDVNVNLQTTATSRQLNIFQAP